MRHGVKVDQIIAVVELMTPVVRDVMRIVVLVTLTLAIANALMACLAPIQPMPIVVVRGVVELVLLPGVTLGHGQLLEKVIANVLNHRCICAAMD
jgi:hypothetical protein